MTILEGRFDFLLSPPVPSTFAAIAVHSSPDLPSGLQRRKHIKGWGIAEPFLTPTRFPMKSQPNIGTSKNSNYIMNIHSNNALVTHNETSTTPSGVVSNTFEVRMVEKVNNDWKLTGQIIQVL